MSTLTKDELAEVKIKLLTEKKRLEDELGIFAIKDEKIEGNYTTPYQDLGSSEDENAIEYTEQERNISLEHTLEIALKDVVNAIKRIDDGSFGLCKYCKKEIPKERLKVRPESSSCIECKSILQSS